MHKCTRLPKQLVHKSRKESARRPRLFSTSTKRLVTLPTHLAAKKHEALTLLYKTENLLEPVFKVAERPSDIQSRNRNASVDFWRDILSDTFENLSTGAERPARIVVYSVNDFSETNELVAALLDDPLSSDQIEENMTILRRCWKDADSSTGLTISANPTKSSPSSIHLSSSYLRQFSVSLEITQLHASQIPRILPSALFKADVPIIVFNPLNTPLSSLKHLVFPSHTLFVIPIAPHLNHSSSTVSQILSELPQLSNSHSPRILFIDPSSARSAIQTFRSDPTSAIAVQQYQDNYNGSGIFHLTNAIRSIVDSGKATSSPLAYLLSRTAIIQLHDTLRAFHVTIEGIQKNLDDIRESVRHLTCKIEEAKVRIPNEIFFGQSASTVQAGKRAVEKDIIGESLKSASKEMKHVLERLSWWKAIWRIDDISGIVGDAVERVWCKDLEQKLILQTGHLLSLQQGLTASAFFLVNNQLPSSSSSLNAPHPLFPANILKNSLSQLTSSPTYTLSPSTLTSSIAKRKYQLFTYSTTRLHLKAQRLVLSTSSTVTVSSGFTWAGWMGYLTQSVMNEPSGVGSAIWSTVGMGMDPITGIGVGLLGVVGSLRWAVGRWEKEKKRWWSDWERIGKGLERDLKVSVDTTMKDRVVVVADAACKGLEELCKKRQNEVDKVKGEAMRLQNQLKDITSQPQQV